MSTKFLHTKQFNPRNLENQKRVWEAQQRDVQRAKEEAEKAAEVKRERERAEDEKMLVQNFASEKDAATALTSHPLHFMYAEPPGLRKRSEGGDAEGGAGTRGDSDDGDDDAVRAMKAEAGAGGADANGRDQNALGRGKLVEVTPLEKMAGVRRSAGLTLAEQVERFPMLKDAPMAGAHTADAAVRFNPLGVTLRNVRCMRCGNWGHRVGDRECPQFNQVTASDQARRARDDPAAVFNRSLSLREKGLALNDSALGRRMGDGEELVLSDDDGAAAGGAGGGTGLTGGDEADRAYIESLPMEEKLRLLESLRRRDKLRKKERKKKRRKSKGASKRKRDSKSTRHKRGRHRDRKHRTRSRSRSSSSAASSSSASSSTSSRSAQRRSAKRKR